MVSYTDEHGVCVIAQNEAATKLSPAFGPILRASKAASDDAALLLVQRNISWGDYSQKVKQARETAKSQISQIRI
jgi:hypothetical protein